MARHFFGDNTHARSVATTTLFLLFTAQHAVAQRNDQFDAGRTYQTIDHFGAHDSWTGQAYGAWNPVQRNQISDALFNKKTGIGLSGWYYNLAAGVDDSIASRNYPWNLRTQETFETGQGQYDWNRNAATGALLGDAKARGVEKFMMTVYSPSLRMTKSGNPYPNAPGGNNLQTGYEQQFATYMADVLEHFKNNPDASQRVDFDYIAPLNEPQYNWNGGSQEGNGFLSNQDIRDQVIALDNELTARGLNTSIRGPESGNIKALFQGQNYINNQAKNSTVSDRLGKTLTYHSYFSDSNADMLSARQNLASAMSSLPDWDVWQTEYAILGNNASSGLVGPGNDLTMTTALAVARTLHYDLSVANVSAWSYWLAATPYEHNYKDGLIYFNQPSQTFEVAKVGRAVSHYSSFLRPGSQRIDFSGSNNDIEGLLVSGWRDDTEQTLSLVYANQLFSNQVVNHGFTDTGSLKADYFTPYLTTDDANTNVAEQAPFLIGQDYSVESRSMVTMVSGTFNENNDGKVFPAIVGDRDYVLGSGSLTLSDGAGQYSGVMSGSGGFTKLGDGEMVLSGNNQYSGQTIVEAGTLALAGTSNQIIGRIGKDSELVIRGDGTVRVDHWNALGGFDPSNVPSVRIEEGGTLTMADDFSANLGEVTFSGGTLASGRANPTFGSWSVNRDLSVLGDVSTISAEDVQIRGDRSITVDQGATLRVTGSIENGATEGTSSITKTGQGRLELARSSVDRLHLSEGHTKLISPSSFVTTISAKSLTIDEGATLDIDDDAVTIDYEGATPVMDLMLNVASGRLTTSLFDREVAVVETDDLGITMLDGIALDSTTLLLISALGGDYNLDNAVDAMDVETMIANYCTTGNGWVTGDGDYDGVVGFSDLVSLSQNYSGPGIDFFQANAKFVEDWNRAFAIPEPSSFAASMVLAIYAMRRRRRKQVNLARNAVSDSGTGNHDIAR